jgi:hydroxymethylpyrimidine pyrophosphatase-like HAD family hydrolase
MTDVDGTLVRRGLDPSPGVVTALQFLDMRSNLVLASGRPLASLRHFARSVGITASLVAANGNHVQAVNAPPEIIALFSAEAIQELLNIAERTDSHALFGMVDGTNCAFVGSEMLMPLLRDYDEPSTEFIATEFPMVQRVPNITHVHLIRPTGWATTPVPELSTMLASVPEFVTATPKGITKADGARAVLGSTLSHARYVVAIGDGQNDVPLFELANIRIGLLGSCEAILRAATHLAPSIENDGFPWSVEAVISPLLTAIEERT